MVLKTHDVCIKFVVLAVEVKGFTIITLKFFNYKNENLMPVLNVMQFTAKMGVLRKKIFDIFFILLCENNIIF